MAKLELVIGDKRYSSWSMRPWLVLKAAELEFREINVRLRQPDTAEQIARHSPSGKVPLLKDGGLLVWDSLAIADYVAELVPERNLWPRDRAERARARSITAEMHAGFPDLRRELSMDVLAVVPMPELTPGAERDVARVMQIWRDCLGTARGGPFLFGAFTIADAFYAPVASRFVTYSIPLDATCRAYVDTILAHAAVRDWRRGAEEEERLKDTAPV